MLIVSRKTSFPFHHAALLALLITLSACGREQSANGPGKESLGPREDRRLTAKVLDNSDDLAIPGDMALVGNSLVVLNAGGDSAVRVYDAASGKLARTFGRTGAGPGEYRSAWSLDPVPGSSSAFWIYDIGLARLTRVDLATDFLPGSHPGGRILQLQASGPVTAPVWSADTMLVSPGYFTEPGRLAQLDGTGRLVRVVGDAPPGKSEVPMPVRQHAYQSNARPNPERSLLAIGTRHSDRLEILGFDGRKIAAAARPVNFEPVYETMIRAGQPTMGSGDDMRFGYIDLTTTSTRVYALYSGRRRGDFPGTANFGEFVHVYDWHAKLLEVIRLDAPAFTIEADEARHQLFAVRMNDRPELVVFDLGAEPR